MRKIVTAGDRVYLKYFDLQYFHARAREADAELVPFRELDDEGFKEAIVEADALVVIDRPVRQEHFEVMERCRIVLALEVGYDFIDLPAATRKGIVVSNVPAYGREEVAVHALTLLLACHRRLGALTAETARGGWDYNVGKPVPDLSGGKLGIVGLGRIGRSLARRARALGLRVLGYDPYLDDDLFALLDVERRYDFEELLSEADFLSLHVPLTEETRRMIGRAELARMKPTAVLVNTCRGKVVDEAALWEAVSGGRLAGAGLDVLEKEPPDPANPLLHSERVIVTPHVAWYSEGSTARLREQGMDEVVRVLGGRRPRFIVNPEVLAGRRPPGPGLPG